MRGRDQLETDSLVESTVPDDEIIVEHELDEGISVELRCSICGTPADEAADLPIGYSNPVCKECDTLAVNESGTEPWTGYPSGERPDTDDGTIHLEPDHGQNPVYIAGVKCWRRYRFGGWITRRDAYDCESLEEFQNRNRVRGGWIHAFNTPHPEGVELLTEQCQEFVDRRNTLETLHQKATSISDSERTPHSKDTELQQSVKELDDELQRHLPSPDEHSTNGYANILASETAYLLSTRGLLADAPRWVKLAELYERYHSTE